jgi:hypothetical protein
MNLLARCSDQWECGRRAAKTVWDASMTNPSLRTPFGEIELRPLPAAPGEVQVYVLLPELDELLGVPGFGFANPIRLPASARSRLQ